VSVNRVLANRTGVQRRRGNSTVAQGNRVLHKNARRAVRGQACGSWWQKEEHRANQWKQRSECGVGERNVCTRLWAALRRVVRVTTPARVRSSSTWGRGIYPGVFNGPAVCWWGPGENKLKSTSTNLERGDGRGCPLACSPVVQSQRPSRPASVCSPTAFSNQVGNREFPPHHSPPTPTGQVPRSIPRAW